MSEEIKVKENILNLQRVKSRLRSDLPKYCHLWLPGKGNGNTCNGDQGT
jgi:hypothetical protein